ncbi:hypothetical protein BDP55DRAFT_629554 [Colletotrichum godetiae]|uniref:Uncharacterized protein n=1 Tax=Colletotrichum godetiae TaxID=1209918 RepID=A0AAJ0AQD6_9PEZI|nr:uncharacterized protein BDP55DRAFT_629554 [Colletotrichum godetiae]KAK1688446.1 hypothetical protein BDP55DRAFT_629554 [Colletotrichum godetiae]
MCSDAPNSELSGMRRLIAMAVAGVVSVISSLLLRNVIQVYLVELFEIRSESSTASDHEREPKPETYLSTVVALLIFNIYSISTYSFNFLRRNDPWKKRIFAGFFAVSVAAAGLTTATLGDGETSFADFIATVPLLVPLSLWFSVIGHSMWNRWSTRSNDEKAPR